MLKGRGRQVRLGVLLVVALSLLAFGAPRLRGHAAAQVVRVPRRRLGRDVQGPTELDALYNESPGCLTVAVPPTVQPLDGSCSMPHPAGTITHREPVPRRGVRGVPDRREHRHHAAVQRTARASTSCA